MDVKEVRKQKFEQIAKKHGRSATAEILGYKDTIYVNQLVGGHSPIGNRTASKIEKAFDLPEGWLDHPEMDYPSHVMNALEKTKDFTESEAKRLARFVELIREERGDQQ